MSDEQGYPAGCAKCAELEEKLSNIDGTPGMWSNPSMWIEQLKRQLREQEVQLRSERERSKALEAVLARASQRLILSAGIMNTAEQRATTVAWGEEARALLEPK